MDKRFWKKHTCPRVVTKLPCYLMCSALFLMAFSHSILAAKPQSTGGVQQHLSLGEFLIEKAKGVFGKDPDRYARTISRNAELRDAVVLLKGGGIDLSPVFEDAGRARYYVRLRPIVGTNQMPSGDTIGPLPFAWDPAKRNPWSANGLRSGLYELELMRRTGDDYRMTGTSAWILISAQGGYEKANATFLEAQSALRGSGDSSEPDTAEALLRACLEILARQQVK